ncbi:MAG: PGPGW domain-containing protein [Rhizobiaceae bacterium]
MNRNELELDEIGAPVEIHLLGRTFNLPRSRLLRVSIGILLVILGIFGFLPVLGFWMIPLGLLILSYDFAFIRRLRRRVAVWLGRREKSR